jgi:hypothetical protein
MPTHDCRHADGLRLQGTPTAIARPRGWNKDARIKWAKREGLAARDIRDRWACRAPHVAPAVDAPLDPAVYGYDPEERAAAVLAARDPEGPGRARGGVAAFQRWLRNRRLVIVRTEVLFGIEEEVPRGFTCDAVADGPLEILDWKSGLRTDAGHLLHPSAQALALERMGTVWRGEPVEVGGAHVRHVLAARRPGGCLEVVRTPPAYSGHATEDRRICARPRLQSRRL